MAKQLTFEMQAPLMAPAPAPAPETPAAVYHTAAGIRERLERYGVQSLKRRDTLRDSGDLVARARRVYLEQRWDSRTHKQAVSVVCETLDLKRRRVNEWAAKFGWEGDV